MKRFLFTFVLCLYGMIAGVLNLFILSDPSPVLAWSGIAASFTGCGITAHHKIHENKRKAIAKQEREERQAERARTEAIENLESGLELGEGKDWAAEYTIDKINKELGLAQPIDFDMLMDAEEPKVYGGYIAAMDITADQIFNGDGDMLAEYTEPGEEKEILTVMKQRVEAIDATVEYLNEQMRQANETARPFWGLR